jgi:hypothetical protein
VGAAQPNNTFCILARLLIPRTISHASALATTLGAKDKQRFGDAREAAHSSDWVKGARI